MRGPSGFTIQGQVNSMGPTVYCVFDELVRGRYMATFQGDLDGWAGFGAPFLLEFGSWIVLGPLGGLDRSVL